MLYFADRGCKTAIYKSIPRHRAPTTIVTAFTGGTEKGINASAKQQSLLIVNARPQTVQLNGKKQGSIHDGLMNGGDPGNKYIDPGATSEEYPWAAPDDDDGPQWLDEKARVHGPSRARWLPGQATTSPHPCERSHDLQPGSYFRQRDFTPHGPLPTRDHVQVFFRETAPVTLYLTHPPRANAPHHAFLDPFHRSAHKLNHWKDSVSAYAV
ncbi:hypothetical protein PWT90_02031 [Aphanocladium album]|nr:hypothetical protein PWT90_02031 [Aphanocladium album]